MYFPLLAIEIGFTQARVEHNESSAIFGAVLEKDRQSEQTFAIKIEVSIPRVAPATPSSSPSADFSFGARTVRLTPEVNFSLVEYTIFEDSIPENTESFLLFTIPDPETPNNPDYGCDSDCFPVLQVLILDDDGEPLLFLGVMIFVASQIHYGRDNSSQSRPGTEL